VKKTFRAQRLSHTHLTVDANQAIRSCRRADVSLDERGSRIVGHVCEFLLLGRQPGALAPPPGTASNSINRSIPRAKLHLTAVSIC
jgi:hypothetical protein